MIDKRKSDYSNPELCLAAVLQDGLTLEFVPEEFKTSELCLTAIWRTPDVFKYVPGAIKTPEFCLDAIQRNGNAFTQVSDELKTRDFCLAAVQRNELAFKYISGKLITPEFCLAAIRQNGWALEHVPENLKTLELCLAAVQQEGRAIRYVPDILKTPEVCLCAVQHHKTSLFSPLELIPDELKTLELCLAAVQHFDYALKLVPEELKTQVSAMLNDSQMTAGAIEKGKKHILMNETSTVATLSFSSITNNEVISICPMTDINELLPQLRNKGIDIITDDPDDCIVSRRIYHTLYHFYGENSCRGDTMNTYNNTFWSKNKRLLRIMEEEHLSESDKMKILEKADQFRHISQAIGNFAVLECWHEQGEVPCINSQRGIGILRDSWPLTLVCIQDYLSGYLTLEENPLRQSFDYNKATIAFFKQYTEGDNGFERFCDDQYLSPKFYGDEPELAYVSMFSNGKYLVKLDLFERLSFAKPLPKTVTEIEQYIEKVTAKIIARGSVLLKEYLNNAKE
jgi:hypothetical protein